jgi:hypothetical protein
VRVALVSGRPLRSVFRPPTESGLLPRNAPTVRLTTPLLAALLLATPALATSPSGNVSQPERAVPQAGTTTGGPLDNPSTRGAAPARGPGVAPAGEGGMTPSAGAVDSAKGGNADQNDRAVPNTGGTSGGPAR